MHTAAKHDKTDHLWYSYRIVFRRKLKSAVLLIIFMFSCLGLHAADRKLRFAGSAGGVIQNDLVGQTAPGNWGGTFGGGASIVYPISPKSKAVNIELGIANWYNFYPYRGSFTHTLRFGFGVRVFLNTFSLIRPYFTHDICSHFVWVSDRDHYASTFGILLGVGMDIPLGKAPRDTESSSLFFDISYNTFSLAAFTSTPEEVRFLSATFGFSWLLQKKSE